jgi:hypothetical protein
VPTDTNGIVAVRAQDDISLRIQQVLPDQQASVSTRKGTHILDSPVLTADIYIAIPSSGVIQYIWAWVVDRVQLWVCAHPMPRGRTEGWAGWLLETGVQNRLCDGIIHVNHQLGKMSDWERWSWKQGLCSLASRCSMSTVGFIWRSAKKWNDELMTVPLFFCYHHVLQFFILFLFSLLIGEASVSSLIFHLFQSIT